MDIPEARDLLLQVRRPGGETQVGDEVNRILRGRLILIALIVVVMILIMVIDQGVHPEHYGSYTKIDYILHYVTLAIYLVPLAYLFRHRSIPLRSLRSVEVLFFGNAVFQLAWAQYRWYNSDWLWGVIVPGHEWKIFKLIEGSFTPPWMFLIILYGVCIPNTGRRAAAVVSAISITGLAFVALLAWKDKIYGYWLMSEIFTSMVFWLTVASTIAVYGSHKISSLQHEAVRSRNLGPYVMKRLLGKGGMGEVYLAEHRLLRRPCAIKLIRPSKAGDPRVLLRFEREVRATAALTHPNVVEIYDYGHGEDGTFYYAMEYLQGLNLEEMVRQHGPLPPERVVHLLRQVCGALKEAHAHGLVHRDVKPGNIIVCMRGGTADVAKLVDFGLVREAAADKHSLTLTQSGIMVGSPLYMSPEQVAGVEPLDGRGDLYSLGLVAYFLLTGANPFRRPTPQAVFAAHLKEPAPSLMDACPSVGPQLHAVVMRCLEKEPDQRYPDAGSLEKALAACPCSGQWTAERAEAWWSCRTGPVTSKGSE